MRQNSKPASRQRGRTDPVITEIVRNGLIAVTEEMKTNLMRTAYNIIIYEALDFTTGLFTPAGETVSIGIGLPMFIRGMAETVKAKIRHFGRAGIKPGDIYVTNDAYLTGSHLNHVTLTLPIFHRGALIGFSCCMAHWLDIGGALGGMTTDIFSEGLQIPILKYQDRGIVNQRSHRRHPAERAAAEPRHGGLAGAGDGGEDRRAALSRAGRALRPRERAGRHRGHHGSFRQIRARARTRTIPDGIYHAESYMDDDGIDIGKPVPIRVKVEVKGDQMTVDLSEVAKQVRGFYNSGITTGHACAQVAYKCLTSPTDYPINDGSFRSLTSIVPPGRVVSATRPAPMRWWMTYPMTIVDTIFKALAPAIPERVIAGHHADLLVAACHGINPKSAEFFIANFGPLGGGWGAKQSEDGVSATVCINDGDTHNSPNEQAEAKFPLVVESYRLLPDSGGAGRHRGGLGVERVVRARTAITMNTQIERAHCKPWGLQGGLAGTGNDVALRLNGTWKTDFPNAKVLVAALKAGDAFRIRSGGGGGYGSPFERPAERVAEDVRQGYVSIAAAAEHYGVVIDPQTLAIDLVATAKLRARGRHKRACETDVCAP